MIIWSYDHILFIRLYDVGLKEDGLVLFCCGRVVGMLYDYGIQYGGSSTNHRGGRERDFRIFTRCSCYVVRTVREWHDGSKALSKYNNFYDKYIHLSRLERGWRLSVDDLMTMWNEQTLRGGWVTSDKRCAWRHDKPFKGTNETKRINCLSRTGDFTHTPGCGIRGNQKKCGTAEGRHTAR